MTQSEQSQNNFGLVKSDEVPVPNMKIQNSPNNWFVVKIVMTKPHYHGQICIIRKFFNEFSVLSVEVSHVCFSIDIQIALIIHKIN